ncbi:MAG: universal stress protein [Burkholderiaceae bacterium]|nr:MAG: universal stress protein [Burkholderiaceae bacterium]
MYQKILLAYNGSEEGRHALLECSDLSKLTQSEIYLLAVMPMSSLVFIGEGFIPTDVVQVEEQRYRRILDDGLEQLKGRGFKVSGKLIFGEPVDEISNHAKEIGADLIVVGHQHLDSWAARWWRGSVSASLIELAPCSVLVAIHQG